MRFGSHIKKLRVDFKDSIKELKKSKGNIVQFFLSSPQSANIPNWPNPELLEAKSILLKNDIMAVVHASYMINIAANWDVDSWWVMNIIQEIKYASVLGAIGVVIHLGKQMSLTLAEAYNNMFRLLIYIHNETLDYSNVKIIIETSAGQGSELCTQLEDLAYFYKKIKNSNDEALRSRIRLCIDTCHIFAAGYDIRTKEKIKLYLDTFEELIGLRYIYLIHLNDSKNDLGSNVDRHQNIGNGYIGLKGLIAFFKYFAKINVPIILETPNKGFVAEIPLLLKYI
jgi:deoxyribonuclease-4